ncbi:MAG TPA: hypothetical protein VLJ60_03370 [bacterium]|nr:hypothetical protein [bacterium]
MQFLVKFKNRQLLYYYVLFLFIIGSCTYGKGDSETLDEAETEEIDEEKKRDDTVTEGVAKDEASSDLEISDESFDEFMDMADEFFFDNDELNDEDISDLPDLNGSWVNLIVFKGKAKPPIIDPPIAWAIMVSKAKIEQNGEIVSSENEMCRLKVGNNSPMLTAVVPDSYAKALDIVNKTAYLSENENGDILFHQPKIWEVRACNLDDPENDELPTKLDDPRVSDPDNTGRNGLRMGSSGVVNGWAEITQKVSTILDGKIESNGEIRGLVQWSEDQGVLWTDNIMLSQGAPTYPAGDPAESLFIYKKIDPEHDCDWIYLNSAALFPEAAALYPEQFKIEGN